MPNQPQISYVDGLQSVTDITVFCFNTGQSYVTYNGDPSETAVETEVRDSDNRLTGGVTFSDARKGTINCSYTAAADEAPGSVKMIRPSYIVSFRGRMYRVGAVKAPVVKGETIKFSFEVTELQNPLIPGLLSIAGQVRAMDVDALTPTNVDCAASNLRAGTTATYSVESWLGGAAPAGVTINATTGVLALNVAVGVHDIRVIVEDDIGDGLPLYGQGRLIATAA